MTSGDALVRAVEVTRGDAVESVHAAAAAVVAHDGRLIAHLGDPDFVTFSRSSLKPFQALPTVMRGFPERFGLAERHLALICASHSGEDIHVQAAREILDAIGSTPDKLQCGVHIPLIFRPEEGGVPPRSDFISLHNNCSGKHSGMLALAGMLGGPSGQYLEPSSPVQEEIRQAVSTMTSFPVARMALGIDGCSAPNYALPLRALALGYARLAASAGNKPETALSMEQAAGKIVRAMIHHPRFVSGTGRLDLALSEAAAGHLFAKAGGEAVECVGIPERGLGIALKVGDGGARAVGPLMVDILCQLDILNETALSALESVWRPQLRNHRGIVVGTVRAVASLMWD